MMAAGETRFWNLDVSGKEVLSGKPVACASEN